MSDSPDAKNILCPETGDIIPELPQFEFSEPLRVVINESLRDIGCAPDTMPCTAKEDETFGRYPGCPCYRFAANAFNQLASAGFVIREDDE